MAAAKQVTVPDASDVAARQPSARRVGLAEVLIVLNAGLMGGVLWKLHAAEQRVGRWEAPMSCLADFGLGVAAASDSVARLFSGGVPGKLTDVLCGDIAGTAAKVEGLAARVERSLLKAAPSRVPANGAYDDEYPWFARVARVFSVVKQVSAVAKGITPSSYCPAPTSQGASGQLTGSGGLVLEPLSYLLDFVANQTGPTDAQWQAVAQQCSEMGKSLAQLNWAGDYGCYKCCVDTDEWQCSSPVDCSIQWNRDVCRLTCDSCPAGLSKANPCGVQNCSWSAQYAIADPAQPVQEAAQWCAAFTAMAPPPPPTPPTPTCLAKLNELCAGQKTLGHCLACVLDNGPALFDAGCDTAMEKTWCDATQADYDRAVALRRA